MLLRAAIGLADVAGNWKGTLTSYLGICPKWARSEQNQSSCLTNTLHAEGFKITQSSIFMIESTSSNVKTQVSFPCLFQNSPYVVNSETQVVNFNSKL